MTSHNNIPSIGQQMPDPSGQDFEAVMSRTLKPLEEYAKKPGIGGENIEATRDKIASLAITVMNSPDRVAFDESRAIQGGSSTEYSMGSHTGTVYDPDKAYVEAHAAKPFMDASHKAAKRGKNGAAHMMTLVGAKAANDAGVKYDANPIETTEVTSKLVADQLITTHPFVDNSLVGRIKGTSVQRPKF